MAVPFFAGIRAGVRIPPAGFVIPSSGFVIPSSGACTMEQE
jgi:hypothetical protein